jgi:ABC-type antimicrobial peptide transport system permease subunit
MTHSEKIRVELILHDRSLLAFSGTYAVVAFLVMQRTREFGIHIALGATASQIVSGILGRALRVD